MYSIMMSCVMRVSDKSVVFPVTQHNECSFPCDKVFWTWLEAVLRLEFGLSECFQSGNWLIL